MHSTTVAVDLAKMASGLPWPMRPLAPRPRISIVRSHVFRTLPTACPGENEAANLGRCSAKVRYAVCVGRGYHQQRCAPICR